MIWSFKVHIFGIEKTKMFSKSKSKLQNTVNAQLMLFN